MKVLVSIFSICMIFCSVACKQKSNEPPLAFDKKLAICDSLYNFDVLARNGMLDRNSFLKYENCLCNTIAPDADIQTDQGLNLSIKKFKGKAIVLYTWNINNPAYAEDLQYLMKRKDESKGKLDIIALSMFDPIGMPPELPTGTGSMNNVILGIEVIRTGFNLKPNFPTAIFIDKDGIVRDMFSGLTYNLSMSKQDREDRIARGIKSAM